MLRTISTSLLAAALIVCGAYGQAVDPNLSVSIGNRNIDPAAIVARGQASGGQVCGTASIPGPKDNQTIVLTIHNSVSDQISNVTIDPFNAYSKRSLVIQSTFTLVPPPGGTLTDLYPGTTADGRGPVVLASSGWDSGEDATLSLDPDTYGNSSFGATVGEMTGTLIEAAYVDTGRRCRGILVFDSVLNASVARLQQVSPVP